MFAAKNALLTAGVGLPRFLDASSVAHKTTGGGPLSFTETIPSDTKLAIVWVTRLSGLSAVPTVTLAGTGMTVTKTDMYFQFQLEGAYLDCCTLLTPSTGSQTIVVTDNANYSLLAASAAYYGNVGSIGTAIVSQQAVASMSHAIASSNPAYLYAQCFCNGGFSPGTISAYNQTQRSISSIATGASGSEAFLFGDAQGNSGTLTFTATQTDASEGGDSIVLPLHTL